MTLLDITSQTWVITIVGWLIVFVALVVLIIVFTNIPKLFNLKAPKKRVKGTTGSSDEITQKGYLSGDETAAIAMAIHMFFDEQHDEESNVITIKRIQRRYSPWSSKIYGLRNFQK